MVSVINTQTRIFQEPCQILALSSLEEWPSFLELGFLSGHLGNTDAHKHGFIFRRDVNAVVCDKGSILWHWHSVVSCSLTIMPSL